jgi:ubiquitin carboxyl-terminal hydrolase 5/13
MYLNIQGVFEHMEDPDFNSPIDVTAQAGASAVGSGSGPGLMEIESLCSLGFSEAQASKALKSTNNDVERAAEWLFSHPDDDGSEDVNPGIAVAAATDVDPAGGTYDLIGIISHLGRNTDCGHYVCHLKKNGQWYFFNDDKVAVSSNPPFDCGFMYMFRRRE